MNGNLATNSRDLTLDSVRALIAEDFAQVNATIRARLASDVVLINQVSEYIIGSGGKRLRPMLVLLAARACGYSGNKHVEAAAIIEFIHTATLLHDDVVDASELRRGQDTANNVFGNEASVLVGDFLYSRSFQMMVTLGKMRVMDVLADATNTIAEGEVLQLLNCNDPDTDEQRYLQVIRRKTARLFEAGTQIAAILADQPEQIENALARYGRHLGTAFQLVDDVLDYQSDATKTGKQLGDDLAEGKPTLPLIHAMAKGDNRQRALVRTAIEKGGREHLSEVVDVVESTGAIPYTARLAQAEAERAEKALLELPDSEFKGALLWLAQFSVERTN